MCHVVTATKKIGMAKRRLSNFSREAGSNKQFPYDLTAGLAPSPQLDVQINALVDLRRFPRLSGPASG